MDVAQAGPVVTLDHVTVRYGERDALHDVSAVLPPGAVGLLGPNGAGKSTLIRSLLGFTPPAGGAIHVLGLDVRIAALAVRRRVGYMPETDAHIPGMNAVAFVAYCGELAGLPRADAIQRAHEVLFYVGLGEARYRRAETYSTGMKQRMKLAQALVHDPDLLLLDEPTNGMDPAGREEMKELIRDLAHERHINVLVSSHLLPDVDATCDYALVLDAGRVAAQGPIANLKGHGRRVFEIRVKGDSAAFAVALRHAGLECHDADDDAMRVYVPEGRESREIFAVAVQQGVQVRHLRPSVPTLEDVFVDAVGAR
jgi:ABC-2 type transport system ATP-binding protein